MAGSFLLVRRQSLKAAEPFWSPPTRRVAQALLPPLFFGFVLGAILLLRGGAGPGEFITTLSLVGSRWAGLRFTAARCTPPASSCPEASRFSAGPWCSAAPPFALSGFPDWAPRLQFGHGIMGFFFGVLHLAYGVYLYFTEPRRNET